MSRAQALHQIVNGLTYGDAITHHALTIRSILRSWGFQSEIFAETISDELVEDAVEIEHFADLVPPTAGVLYHYSMYSSANRLVRQSPNPLFLVYHNITTSRFFVPYNSRYTALLERGLRELTDFRTRVKLAFADSAYNKSVLDQLGYPETRILPIFFDQSLYGRASNRVVRHLFQDGYTNILSVGRIVPQKRIEDLIKMFAFYRRKINNRSRLIIVGEHRGFERYFYALLHLIDELHLGEVYFTGLLPHNELRAFYRLADVFVSASEHEGFCVPLLESMFYGVPIIARSSGAIPETLAGAGIQYQGVDPVVLAELVQRVVQDQALRQKLGRFAQKNLRRFSHAANEQVLQALVTIMDETR
ncbi:glycosyltransferase [bacterium]|nr:glycosyltransferase [bacterium]